MAGPRDQGIFHVSRSPEALPGGKAVDAAAHAVVESIHAEVSVQLVRVEVDQVLIKGHGVCGVGAAGDESDADSFAERGDGVGERGGVGDFYSHVFDGGKEARMS